MVRVSVYVCVGGERSMVSDWHMYSSAVKPAGTLHEYGTQLSQQLLKNNKIKLNFSFPTNVHWKKVLNL